MFSTITTAPSTTRPKSNAPSESRFAGMWRRSRQIDANSSENGIVRATIRALRTLPRKRKRTIDTRMKPSVRLRSTVRVVWWIRSLRSRNGTIFTPGGRIRSLISWTFAMDRLQRRLGVGALAQKQAALDDVRHNR